MNIAFSPPPRSSVPLMPHRFGLFWPSLNCSVPCPFSLPMYVSPTSISPYRVTLLCAFARIETAASAVANATHVHIFFTRRLLFVFLYTSAGAVHLIAHVISTTLLISHYELI